MFIVFWNRCWCPCRPHPACKEGRKHCAVLTIVSVWYAFLAALVLPKIQQVTSHFPPALSSYACIVQGGVSAPALEELRSESTDGKLLWLNSTEPQFCVSEYKQVSITLLPSFLPPSTWHTGILSLPGWPATGVVWAWSLVTGRTWQCWFCPQN